MLTTREEIEVDGFYLQLKGLNSVTVQVQSEMTSICDARVLLSSVSKNFPEPEHSLNQNANLNFIKNTLVKTQNCMDSFMTADDTSLLECLEKPDSSTYSLSRSAQKASLAKNVF